MCIVPFSYISFFLSFLLVLNFVKEFSSAVDSELSPKIHDTMGIQKNIEKELFGKDTIVNGTCDYDIHLVWSTQLGSSVFATPLITDVFSDGKKDIIIPTITHFLEAVDGVTGQDIGRFPFSHPRLRSHASVLPVDIDGDGVNDYMVSTYSGEFVFVDEYGNGLTGRTVKLPSLQVPLKTFDRPLPLAEMEKNDHTEDNIKKNQKLETNEQHAKDAFNRLALQPNPKKQNKLTLKDSAKGHSFSDSSLHLNQSQEQQHQQLNHQEHYYKNNLSFLEKATYSQNKRNLLQIDEETAVNDNENDNNNGYNSQDSEKNLAESYDDYYNRGYIDDEDYFENIYDIKQLDEDFSKETKIGVDGWLSPEAKSSMDLVFHPELYQSSLLVKPENDIFLPHNDPLSGESLKPDHIYLNPHILSTPVVVDIDGDGSVEVIVTVTYYLDLDEYPMDKVADPEMYVATSVVCMNLNTGKVRWSKLLFSSSKHITYPAYGISSPLVINVDQDYLLDIFISTSEGKIFGFDSKGNVKEGWPTKMEPIIGTPIAVDINGDGKVDICAGDVKGTLSCFDTVGKNVMKMQISGSIVATPTAGDVNADGIIDIVVGTTSGDVYVIDTSKHEVLPNFPVNTKGPVVASALLVNMLPINTSPKNKKTLDIVVPSNSGDVYVISSKGCFEIIDIGEKIQSMVLADDLTNNDKLDLVITTMSGTISLYETITPFTPLKAWRSKPNSLNSMTASEGYLGIFIEPESRIPHDVRGDSFSIRFTIVDKRLGVGKNFMPRYAVYVMVGQRLIIGSVVLYKAGTHSVRVAAPLERIYTTVSVIMTTPNAMRFEDSVAMSFNMHFLDGAKYILIIPFFIWCIALALVKKEHTLMDPVIFRRYQQTLRMQERA